ncbi:MAG: MerR family transcriptional regulator [Pseudomonadota bacterium]
MEKSRQAFRTISEVADGLGTQPHVLRFWESKFPQVKPVKRAGGRRYYRPADVDLLGGIKQLLHGDGMTIKGVQKVLRDRGVKYVAAIGSQGAPAPQEPPSDAVVIPLERKSEATPSRTTATDPDSLGFSRVNALRRAAHVSHEVDTDALAALTERLKALATRMQSTNGPW